MKIRSSFYHASRTWAFLAAVFFIISCNTVHVQKDVVVVYPGDTLAYYDDYYDDYYYDDSSYYDDYYDDDYYDDYEDYSYAPVYNAAATHTSDLVSTVLDVKLLFETSQLTGKANIVLKPHFYATNELVLDAKYMDVREVSIVKAGKRTPLQYTYDSLQLHITLDKEYKKDEQFEIFVDYTANPERVTADAAAIAGNKGLYFINPKGEDKDKPTEVWSQGETEYNSVWFPTIDKPNQKTTVQISLNTPDKYVTLSNGNLIKQTKNAADGTRTDVWKQDLPISPYVIMIFAGPHKIIHDKWGTMPVDYYVEEKYAPYAKDIFGNTPEMIDFYSKTLGVKYPWSKYDQVIVRDFIAGAMENVGAVTHAEYLNQTSREMIDDDYESQISHELFHHWFGDYVTCESWSNIPLNESFATYGEYMWIEHKYGIDEADYHSMNDLDNYIAEAESKQVDLIRFDYSDKEEMFDAHSYQKGGRVLRMLRNYLGDEAFYAGLKLYLESNKFKSVEIHNLRMAMEEVSGQDLNWFFNEWFLSKGHPLVDVYHYYYASDSGGVDVTLDIYNSRSDDGGNYPFRFPVKIDFYVNGQVITIDTTVDDSYEYWTFNMPDTPQLVNFDADKVLLCSKTEDKTVAEYVFQYRNAPKFMDRYEAVENFALNQYDSTRAFDGLVLAMDDKFWAIRKYAIDNLDSYSLEEHTTVMDKLATVAKKDPKSKVRAAAIDKLGYTYKDEYMSLYEDRIKNDSSYSVISSSLSAVLALDTNKAFEMAKTLQNEDASSIISAVADIYAVKGGPEYATYFEDKMHSMGGFQKYVLMTSYGKFLARMEDEAIIRKGIETITEAGKDESQWWMKYGASSALQTVEDAYNQKYYDLSDELNALAEDDLVRRNQVQKKIDSVNDMLDFISTKMTELNGEEESFDW